VVCGCAVQLCPGLNTVVRELVFSLWQQYGVHDILGIDGGYRGFYAKNTIQLDPKKVGDIHKRGGTFLGTSRGGHETTKIVNSIEDRGINQVSPSDACWHLASNLNGDPQEAKAIFRPIY
jgi:6-phosphofructokinase